ARAREDSPQSQYWRGFPAVLELSQLSLFSGYLSLFSGLPPFFPVPSTYRPYCAGGRIRLFSRLLYAVE
ncbi:TPA: hypothetical protein ACQVG8_005131, partial [Serratia marcescens]